MIEYENAEDEISDIVDELGLAETQILMARASFRLLPMLHPNFSEYRPSYWEEWAFNESESVLVLSALRSIQLAFLLLKLPKAIPFDSISDCRQSIAELHETLNLPTTARSTIIWILEHALAFAEGEDSEIGRELAKEVFSEYVTLSGNKAFLLELRLDAKAAKEYSESAMNSPACRYSDPDFSDVGRKGSYETSSFAHALIEAGPAWLFWLEFYGHILDGKPLDWELQRRVALIPDADWEQGPAHIAAKIDEIKAAFLAEKVPLAETVTLNPATNLFHVVPIPVQNAPLVGALLSRVVDAVEDAVQGNNGLRADSREVRVLTRAAQRYGNDPQRLEMDFTSVAVGLRRQVHATRELPESEDNLALLEAVEEGARGLRAAHPEVAANRTSLAAQALRELSPDQKAELAEALPVLQAISEGVMAEDFAADIPALINDALLPLPTCAPRLPGMDAAARVFSRAAKISVWAKTSGYIHTVDGHAVYKAARIATTLAGLVTIGVAIYGVL